MLLVRKKTGKAITLSTSQLWVVAYSLLMLCLKMVNYSPAHVLMVKEHSRHSICWVARIFCRLSGQYIGWVLTFTYCSEGLWTPALNMWNHHIFLFCSVIVKAIAQIRMGSLVWLHLQNSDKYAWNALIRSSCGWQNQPRWNTSPFGCHERSWSSC